MENPTPIPPEIVAPLGRRCVALVVCAALALALAAGRWWRARPQHDWLFVYVMAYDNDLDRCTAPITEALARGQRAHDNVAVAILADGRARDGLRRTLLTREGERVERLATEDITDARVLRDFLAWAAAGARARRQVVVFLDHGGALDQMGYDAHTRREGEREGWISARASGEALRAWRREGRDVPMVFLQQCGRASVEGLQNFRGAADAVLASQRSVGACNTYYETLLAAASRRPDASPRLLARAVMDSDRHYATYALLRGSALDAWRRESDALVSALLDGPAPAPTPDAMRAVSPCFAHGLERNYDLLQTVHAAAAGRGDVAARAVARFDAWVRAELVMEHRRRPHAPEAAGWCGVSMHVPALGPFLELYRAQPAYREGRWAELARALAPGEFVVRPSR